MRTLRSELRFVEGKLDELSQASDELWRKAQKEDFSGSVRLAGLTEALAGLKDILTDVLRMEREWKEKKC